jgi:hypothetical protein
MFGETNDKKTMHLTDIRSVDGEVVFVTFERAQAV